MAKKEIKQRKDLRILLVQMRGDETKQHEMDCLLRYGHLEPEQLISYDALTDSVTNDIIEGMDAVIVGGANEFRVSHKDFHQLEEVEELVRHCTEKKIPLLGICYGAHVIAEALGGTVEYTPDRKEVSNHVMTCMPAATDDELLYDMPKKFKANCGRTDNIISIPEHMIHLVKSELSEYHIFRVPEAPVYAVQFHAELCKKDEWTRMDFAHAHGGYFKDNEDLQNQKDKIVKTPEATSLIEKFVDRIVLPAVNS